jgi:hypothetical protein
LFKKWYDVCDWYTTAVFNHLTVDYHDSSILLV